MASYSQSKVYFFFNNKRFTLKDRNRLKEFIQAIFKKEKRGLVSLNYIFTTDKAVLEINRNYLKHDYYTDIITFELNPPGQPVEAEVYISVDRVKDNAGELGVSVKHELLRVIFHGALHLCGYRDKSKSDIARMREREEFYMQRFLEG